MRQLVFFSALLLASCQGAGGAKALNFSVKNEAGSVLTVIYQDGLANMRIINGLCYKFAAEDFPMTAALNHSGSSLELNEPAHYIIEGPDAARKSPSPCQPDDIE